jgi:hypothetical protein
MSNVVSNNVRGFSQSFPATTDIVRSVGQRPIPYPLQIIIPSDIWRYKIEASEHTVKQNQTKIISMLTVYPLAKLYEEIRNITKSSKEISRTSY